MNGTYDVCLEAEKIGWVKLSTCGLYCVVECQCCWPGESMMHLVMLMQEGIEDLGLMIPEQGRLCLRKKMSLKKMPKEITGFELRERKQETEEFFVIEPHHSFPYLHRLYKAKFTVCDEKIGLTIPKNP